PAALAADAFSLPVADRCADWVVSTLVFHHFSPEQNAALLREFSRVARRGFAILDLRRHYFPWIFVSIAGRIIFESRVSLFDGQASVLQAYTPEEARAIVRDAVPGSRVERIFPYRLLISGPGA
ncbi:MAG: methyltransferase domain-containing protein, partial [Thermoanaerobaculia bacterium]